MRETARDALSILDAELLESHETTAPPHSTTRVRVAASRTLATSPMTEGAHGVSVCRHAPGAPGACMPRQEHWRLAHLPLTFTWLETTNGHFVWSGFSRARHRPVRIHVHTIDTNRHSSSSSRGNGLSGENFWVLIDCTLNAGGLLIHFVCARFNSSFVTLCPVFKI